MSVYFCEQQLFWVDVELSLCYVPAGSAADDELVSEPAAEESSAGGMGLFFSVSSDQLCQWGEHGHGSEDQWPVTPRQYDNPQLTISEVSRILMSQHQWLGGKNKFLHVSQYSSYIKYT